MTQICFRIGAKMSALLSFSGRVCISKRASLQHLPTTQKSQQQHHFYNNNNNKINNCYNLFSTAVVHCFKNSTVTSNAQDFQRATKKPGKSNGGSGKYADSLNLPHMPYKLSDFKPDGQCNERESYIRKITDFDGLYEWQQEHNTGSTFTIHDGPPYANGSLHVGHALNKIIKDVINRYKVLRGHKVNFVPGWDCHGLPIENKAKASAGTFLSDIQIRKQAHRFSRDALELQREEFKQWGIMADWDNPYITSDVSFVQNELHLLQRLHDKGLVYQDYMPVYWSPSSKTALAEAELEYNPEHSSQSVYVRLALMSLPDQLRGHVCAEDVVDVVIWTTTPWTLPANQAVCFSPNLQYSLIRLSATREHLIIAQELTESTCSKLDSRYDIISTFSGETLSGLSYQHPIYKDKQCPLLPANHVTSTVGTGFVHTAPAHGHEDFKVALKYALSKECMVDENGLYTAEAGEELVSKHVFDEGNSTVMALLRNKLLHTENYIHKYPYDWRSKEPVMVRASSQWFIDTNKLIEPAMSALQQVDVFPSVYKAPLCDSISQRPYWCISRQRAWGVPIPAFLDEHGKAYMHRAITDHLRQLIGERGTDVWWEADDITLLPDAVRAKAGIPRDLRLTKGRDIIDIWFDSGVTWSAVLGTSPADIYIEGVDQIRGWFQSSLLTSVALYGHSPYKSLMLHGFTVDENEQKMSKSLGNVVLPSHVIYGDKNEKPGYGIDVLRWWAASKYSVTNVDIGPNMIRQCNDKMLQVRKRMRFILGNVYDFIPEKHSVDYSDLPPQDQYFLHLAYEYADKVTKCYDGNELSSVLKWLEPFMARFSNIYATLSKDRLYCFPEDSLERRSAQTVLHHTFDILVYSTAPIIPLFSEDCFVHRYGNQLNRGSNSAVSIFRTGWLTLDKRWHNSDLAERFEVVYSLVEEIRAELETRPLETVDVMFVFDREESETFTLLQDLQEDADLGEMSSHTPLCETVQCASVGVATAEYSRESDIVTSSDYCRHVPDRGLTIYIKEAAHIRCERCRRYTATTSLEPCVMCLLNMADTWAS